MHRHRNFQHRFPAYLVELFFISAHVFVVAVSRVAAAMHTSGAHSNSAIVCVFLEQDPA